MQVADTKFRNYVLNGQWKRDMNALSRFERSVFCGLILLLILLIAYDLRTDFLAEQSLTHIVIDFAFGIFGSAGLIFAWILLGRARIGHMTQIINAENSASNAQNEAAHWKFEAEAIQKGIADEIDRQMAAWLLTPSEKEVAFLVLKGLSLKEISTVRGTAERTVRHHTLSIYAKAGVTGRAELSAFFLEEFLDRQGSISVLSHRIKERKENTK